MTTTFTTDALATENLRELTADELVAIHGSGRPVEHLKFELHTVFINSINPSQ